MTHVKKRITKALNNEHLTRAVLKSTTLSVKKRDHLVAEMSDFEAVRATAREVRQRSIDNFQAYSDQFADRFVAAGGVIHHASTAKEACDIVLKLLKEENAIKGVKSKSMVTEEIGLGQQLEAHGIDAVESDLGEYIVQLAGEPPSHITAPALHRSRESIGRLFADKLGVDYTDNPEELTAIARKLMRDRFTEAQFAISGANFMIAETGHIAIVENEGNVKMGLSVPPLYITVAGIDKFLEKPQDLDPIMQLLPTSATGQRATAYFHLLKPTQTGEDGPEQMHMILLDNGRSAAMQDPEYREMMLCIRCGACLNICPVYRSVGGHAYGTTYPGPMGAVLSNLLGDVPMSQPELPELSSLCGACKDICPVKIDIPRMLLGIRNHSEKPLLHKAAAVTWKVTMQTPQRYEIGSTLFRTANKLLSVVLKKNPFQPAKRSFRDLYKARKANR
jgi:L-lactate dehydrogenase complex protein LldF